MFAFSQVLRGPGWQARAGGFLCLPGGPILLYFCLVTCHLQHVGALSSPEGCFPPSPFVFIPDARTTVGSASFLRTFLRSPLSSFHLYLCGPTVPGATALCKADWKIESFRLAPRKALNTIGVLFERIRKEWGIGSGTLRVKCLS